VNLIGEHTDYNDGFVMPVAIDRHIVVAASPRSDNQINLVAMDFANQSSTFCLDDIKLDERAVWSNYARGVVWSLKQAGYQLKGMDAVIGGDVPIGAGLSSSAALEVASGLAITRLSGIDIEPKSMALLAQYAENQFVGMRCGIMDQFIACLGQAGHALLIDCRSLDHRLVPLNPAVKVVVVNSGVQRGLRDSEYNSRRDECETVAKLLGVPALRDIDEETFAQQSHSLPEIIRSRARHVVSENTRTLETARALDQEDYEKVGKLMFASHASLRDDYQVSCPELNLLVELAAGVPGVYGARLTGAGFGGCIVALANTGAEGILRAAISEYYPLRTGKNVAIFVCQASEGASEYLGNNS
jgi:galactokinase